VGHLAPPDRPARQLGVRVIEMDGSRDRGAVAGRVADHLAGLLPRKLSC
jgi:hypothetical protein